MTKDKSFYRTFIKLMVALMLQQAVVLSVNLADNIMLGNYSETALSGVAAVNMIQFILQQIIYNIANAMVVISSQYWGQKRKKPMQYMAASAFLMANLVAISLFIIVCIAPYQLVEIFTNEKVIIEEGVAYLNIIKFSYIFFSMTTILLNIMRCVEEVSIALKVSVFSLIINCFVNYSLIYGNFGLPRMGVRGAAIGTLIARIIEFIIASFYVFNKDKSLSLRPVNIIKIDKMLFNDYIKIALPMAFGSLLWGFSNALQTVIMGHLSANAIAAHSISSTLFLFLKVMTVGAAQASAVIIAQVVGAGNTKKVKEYTVTLQIIFIIIGIILFGIMIGIRTPLLSLYSLSSETYTLASIFIIIEAVVLALNSYQMSMNNGVISGGGNTIYMTKLDIIFIWFMCLPASLIAAFYLDASPVIILLCLNFDQILKCVPAFIYGNSYKWIRQLTTN